MRLSGRVLNEEGKRVGRLDLRLSGIIDAEIGITMQWQSLGGDGRLRLNVPD